MPIKMKALRRHYAKAEGKQYGPGENFNAVDQHEADFLVRMKRAEVVKTTAAEPQRYITRDQTASRADAPTQEEPSAPRKARRYNRRDLRAEGE